MDVRRFQPGDDAELARFYGRVEGEGSEVPHRPNWRWKYLEHPETPKPPLLSLGWKDGGLVGATGAVPVRLIRDGEHARGAQLIEPEDFRSVEPEQSLAIARDLVTRLAEERIEYAFAVVIGQRSRAMLEALGFEHSFDVQLRNLYLGLGSVSTRLDETALNPVRRLAKFARRLRLKLMEVPFEESWMAYAARLFAQRRPELAFAVERSQDYLRWRYRLHPEHKYRLLVLRRNAGTGIDAFAIARVYEARPGRKYVQLIDHWTRIGERRWTAWLLGEMALWGLAEHADVLQAFAPANSVLDQVLVSLGCIRKVATVPFLTKTLSGSAAPLLPGAVQLRAGDLDLF
jgi:hypothetical protein